MNMVGMDTLRDWERELEDMVSAVNYLRHEIEATRTEMTYTEPGYDTRVEEDGKENQLILALLHRLECTDPYHDDAVQVERLAREQESGSFMTVPARLIELMAGELRLLTTLSPK